jgi:hypothetical protein
MPLRTMRWSRQPSGADPGQLAGPAHLPAAGPVGVGLLVRMSGRAPTSESRPRSTPNPNINRRTSLRAIRVRAQAPEFLLGLPAPDAVLLTSGDGVCQALDLDWASVTDGQRLPLSRGGQAGCCPAVPAQHVQVGREEDVLVGRRHHAPAGRAVHPRAEPGLEVAATARHVRLLAWPAGSVLRPAPGGPCEPVGRAEHGVGAPQERGDSLDRLGART